MSDCTPSPEGRDNVSTRMAPPSGVLPGPSENSRRIARNTVFLYFRMILLLLIGLYTSRVVIRTLGRADLGLYGAVAGVVLVFSVLTASMSSAISRFMTYELGKPDARPDKVFSTALTVQILLSVIIVVLCETAGLWWLKTQMVFPPERMGAALAVFHLSVVSFVFQLLSVPYNAAIIAHEKMDAFAYIGVIEGVLKLGVAISLAFSPVDKLVFYALLMCLVSFVVRLLYGLYCRRHFAETRYSLSADRTVFREMFAFAGWNFIGSGAAVLRDQGGNQLLNLYSGLMANAAWTLTTQVNTAVQKFATSFMTAFTPQILKSFAAGERDYMLRLVFRGSRYSVFLLLLVACPLIFEMPFLADLWLGADAVPPRLVLFVRLVLVASLLDAVSHTLIAAVNANGKIRDYQLVVGGLLLLNIPVDYVLLKGGAPDYIIYVVAIAIAALCLAARLLMLRKLIAFPVGSFLRESLLVEAGVVAAAFLLPYLALRLFSPTGWCGFLLHGGGTFLWTVLCVYLLGLTADERQVVRAKIRRVR